MKMIYVHGFESSAKSTKGRLLQEYCAKHHLTIEVLRPDLNMTPKAVLTTLCQLVEEAQTQGEQVVLLGSSLGGYFSTLTNNKTGCPIILLNPSTQPHISLQRLLRDNVGSDDGVVHQTEGGWQVTLEDLRWFEQHILEKVVSPKKAYVIIKAGDELLNPMLAKTFYQSQGVSVDWQAGGDHRMSDFAAQLPRIMQQLPSLLT